MAKALTQIAIDNLKSGPIRREVPDGKVGGLYIVIQPSAAMSWAVRYRTDGRSKKLTLGPYPAIDLAGARRLAQRALSEVAEGKDPAAMKQTERRAAKSKQRESHDRLDRVIEMFIERYAKPKTGKGTWRETERILRKEVASPWAGRRLSEIKRADVHDLLDKIVDRPAPILANRTLAALRRMCAWAVERGIITVSPCDSVRAPAIEASRDRVLDDHELRLAWRAFERVGWPFGPLAQLLLLTGARRDEVAGMKWAEIDLAARVWTLAKERTKSKRPHAIPLSEDAVNIIEALPRIERKADLCFTTNGETAVSGFSRAKRGVDKAIRSILEEQARARDDDPADVVPPKPWVFHDIRRTVATNLQKLSVRLEVTEAVLNHVSGSRAGIVGVYQKYGFEPEKRAALDAWARKLSAIVTGAEASNVDEATGSRAGRVAPRAGPS